MSRPIYLISDGGELRRRGTLISVVSAALEGAGGAIGYVQLREQLAGEGPASDGEVIDLGEELLPLCRQHGAKLILNRRLDLATAVGADGVHLQASIAGVESVRETCSADFLIGFSAHSEGEAIAAVDAGADYVFLSPIFAPISKQSQRSPLGLEALSGAAAELPGKVFALGGITAKRAAQCRRAGAAGVALVGSVMFAAQPGSAAREIAAAWAGAEPANQKRRSA